MSQEHIDAEVRVQTVCLVILASVATAFALYWLAPVLIPFVLALFISMGLAMCVDWLVRRVSVPRALALPVTLVLGIGALLGLGALISASVAQLAENVPQYAEQLGQLIDRTAALLPAELAELVGDRTTAFREIPVASVGGVLASTTNAVLNLLSKSLLVLIFVIFLLLGGSRSDRQGTFGEIRRSVESYLLSKVIISAATGLLVGITLIVLDIPLAMAFGVLAFLLNFIPNVGSLIATLLPLPVVIVSPDVSSGAAAAAILVPAAIQGTMGNAIEPKFMGDSLDLHPIVILISLIFWGMLWGIVGMLLATPITAILKLFLAKFDGSRPVSELLAGRLDMLDADDGPGEEPEEDVVA